MLKAIPKRLFSQDFQIVQDDKPVALLDVAMVRRRGEIVIGDQVLRVQAQGVLRPEYALHLDGRVIAEARKPSMLRDRVELRLGDVTCEIRRRGALGMRFEVSVADRPIGQIARKSFFSRTADINLPDDWPLGLQVFTFWIVLLFWRQQASSSSS